MFDEKALYDDIVKTWGEHGAHAEVYRSLCVKAGVSLISENEEEIIKCFWAEENESKMNTIKRVRWEFNLDLIAAKTLVERYI